MGPDLPEIPLNVDFLLSAPGGYVDLSPFSGSGVSVRLQDKSTLDYAVGIQCLARFVGNDEAFFTVSDAVPLFRGPVGVQLLFSGNGGDDFLDNRVYLIFTAFTRSRVVRAYTI